jgi:hypothetical protein
VAEALVRGLKYSVLVGDDLNRIPKWVKGAAKG